MSLIKPKIQTSVHFCEETKRGHIKNYNDPFNLALLANDIAGGSQNKELTNAFPTKDAHGNPLTCEYGYCVYKDS